VDRSRLSDLIWTCLVCALAAAPAPAAAAAHAWSLRDGGRLGFVASWEGSEFDGVFHKFDANVAFDPADLADSRFDIEVDVTSADTQSSDRDDALGDPEWFDFPHHPKASFVSSSIAAAGDGRYEAKGTLTIKGVSRDITFPFTWQEQNGAAELKGETTLLRTDFHIGEGEWAEDDTIGMKVRVLADLTFQAKSDAP
jgi:polyisoprenoid-binding protein YceI